MVCTKSLDFNACVHKWTQNHALVLFVVLFLTYFNVSARGAIEKIPSNCAYVLVATCCETNDYLTDDHWV